MTDKEKIRAEIERRLEELNPKKGELMGRPLRDVNPKTFPRERELEKLLSFINSLQEEPVSEDLEKAAEEYAKAKHTNLALIDIVSLDFKAGAQWQRKQMMKDAVDVEIRRNRYTKKNVLHGLDVTCNEIQRFKDRDKLKLIFIKENLLWQE